MLRIRGARTLLGAIAQPWASCSTAAACSSSGISALHFQHPSPQQQHLDTLTFSRHAHSGPSALDHLNPSTSDIDAFTSAEALLFFLSPTQLGTQAFHSLHTLTGLPWWVSIPLTTLAARLLLAPLSIKAKAASASFPILSTSLAKARLIRSKISADLQNQAIPAIEAKGPAMWTTTRLIQQHLRKQQHVPPFRWYILNAAAQAAVLSSLTWALHYMCASVWPGLVSEGLLYFKDLTAPALYLQTLSTPCGTMGAVLPLGMVLLYLSSTEMTAGARVPGIVAALRLLAVPLYCSALLQPHAVLLCWGSAGASHYVLQAALQRSLGLAARLGMPPMLLPHTTPQHQNLETVTPAAAAAASGSSSGSSGAAGPDSATAGSAPAAAAPSSLGEQKLQAAAAAAPELAAGDEELSAEQGDAELLTFLGKHFSAAKRKGGQGEAVAASCFRLALELQPNSAEALAGLAALGARG